MKGKSYTDQVFTSRQSMGQSNEWNATISTIFIDVAKAFDSIHRQQTSLMEDHGSLQYSRKDHFNHQDDIQRLLSPGNKWHQTNRQHRPKIGSKTRVFVTHSVIPPLHLLGDELRNKVKRDCTEHLISHLKILTLQILLSLPTASRILTEKQMT